jgi:hypothetical protein
MKSFLDKISSNKHVDLSKKNDAQKVSKLAAGGKLEEASLLLTQYAHSVNIEIEAESNSARQIGVNWHAYKPDLCVFNLNQNLSKERIQFIVVRLTLLLPLIVAFHKSSSFVPGAIFINLDDFAEADGIAFCSDRDEQILIPDTDFLESKGYANTRNYFDLNPIAWKDRLPVAFWRGNTTGIRSGDSWKTIPRIRLCEICSNQELSGLFDVGISGLAQIPRGERKALQHSGLLREFVPILSGNQYKYQIDIDGNSNAWSGLFQKLLSKSAVLKVSSPHGFQQWYYDRLIPWEHFVPVESGMMDLVEKTQWLVANDGKAMRIGPRGAEFASNLSYDLMMVEAIQNIRNAFLKRQSTASQCIR